MKPICYKYTNDGQLKAVRLSKKQQAVEKQKEYLLKLSCNGIYS